MKNKLFLIALAISLLMADNVSFGQAPNLGTASGFALFTANGALTNSGASMVTGAIGTNAGAFSGFNTATVVGQTRLPGSPEATQAALDVTAAYNALTTALCGSAPIGPLLGNGQVITPGIYCQNAPATASTLTGTLTLNGAGVYIIRLNGALTTATGSSISLTNGASFDNVYFQVNGAVDVGVGSVFKGTILANGAIRLLTGASLDGRGLSIAGAISLSENTVTAVTASLGGLVFSDTNGDGIQNGSDSPLSGVAVTLLNSTNTPISSTTTSVSGLYSFTGLMPGTPYSVSFTTPANYTTTGATAGGIAGPITLTAGENNTSLGAGYRLPTASVTPALAITVTATDSQTATNQYTLTGSISLTATPAGILTITDGTSTTTVSITAGQTSVGFRLAGLVAGITSHTVTVSGAAYSPVSVTYTGPAAVSLPASGLAVQAFGNTSRAKIGDVLTYSLVLTNAGSTSATTTVRDSISAGGTYITGSATVPPGTIFNAGQPTSLWTVPVIGAGQSLTLTIQVRVNTGGILYNILSIPGDTVRVCTSIPMKMCVGDEYTLTVPAGRAAYQWYKDNLPIPAQTTNVLVVIEPGTYSLGIANTGGLCPDFSCCPFILELDTLPAYQVVTTAATCIGTSPDATGKLVLDRFNATHTYQYSLGAVFNPAASLSGVAQAIPVSGVIATTLPNPAAAQPYTVRVYNSSGCYTDMTVLLIPTVCACPVTVCVPYVLTRTKRPVR